MKKAYNVYSILGKAVSKVAMLTSVFALCFLFSSQVFSQTVAPTSRTSQTDLQMHLGAPAVNALVNNVDRLNPNLIQADQALPIAKNLFYGHIGTPNNATTSSDEMEYELRRTFLEGLANGLKGGSSFGDAFTFGTSNMLTQYVAYDTSTYSGTSPNSIAEGYIVNFF